VLRAEAGIYTPRGRAPRPCGSLLDRDDVSRRRGLNFLDQRVEAYATKRTIEVQTENGTLDEYRLRHNMLSSMPMCFNLFGMIREVPESQLEFVRLLFDPRAMAVELIECEWTPRKPESTINDRSAFDAAVVTRRADGSRHLIGVETKYTESFSSTRYGAQERRTDAGRYRDIHARSGWFYPSTHDELTASPTNQLWRNCLLAAASERAGEFHSAEVVVVALNDDRGAMKAIAGVTAAMTDPTRCRAVSLESIVETSQQIPPLAAWAGEFKRRYLDLGPLDARPAISD
jgi:hypothetical protein